MERLAWAAALKRSRPRATVVAAFVWALMPTTACMEPDPPAPPPTQPPELALDEPRVIELRYNRFDVAGYEQRLDFEALSALPRAVLDQVWLLDLDLLPLTSAALAQLRQMSPEQAATLSLPAQNLRRLMTMTPDNAVLDGTSLGPLIALSAAVGIPPAKALANLLDTAVTDPLAPSDITAQVFVDQLVASHPNAQTRPGPVTEAYPDGTYPVSPGSIPISLGDVVDEFSGLAGRFGPAGDHPGVITEASDIRFATDDFQMSVKVTANVLPYRGVDLTNGDVGAVNAVPAQFEGLFDFTDPTWMQIEGLDPDPAIGALTIRVVEDGQFIPGGDSQEPPGLGNSPAWTLPPWTFESIIAEVSRRTTAGIPDHCDSYLLGTGTTAFEACIADDGWTSLVTFADIGDPPPPKYLWDYVLEIAQIRLHDGGLAEGEATADLDLSDVPLGVPPEVLVDTARSNLEAAPDALRELTRALTDTARGDPDFFYLRAEPETGDGTDYLYFVIEDDLRRDEDGALARPYDYANPGFFADAALTEKLSTTEDVDGDLVHEKLAIAQGDAFFAGDDAGRVFKIEVGNKPSRRRVLLRITRVQ